uniref:Uncharacterized mitochondrial protein AtMg00810-like n=1 Tax=Nicotiana tabacum TaxID=4097 RepID=A0A1S3Y0E2_TOBAC|nr:PREDICTED: uncharacterized mitochondrial protein AtMg00810-like [Nicotiana tabacum]
MSPLQHFKTENVAEHINAGNSTNGDVNFAGSSGLAVDNPEFVCKLNKSLYGLKQASRQFYVDEIVVTGTDTMEIEELKTFLNDSFKIKDLGRLHYFLGLEVLYKGDGVIISKRKFTLDLLKEYQCMDHNSFASPLDPTIKLRAKEGDNLSQFMDDPRQPHLKVAFHLLRYLKADPTLGIFLSKDADYTIKAYCDSDWVACPDFRKSLSGYLVLLGNNPISWKSKKQDTISLSSAEVEYKALRKVVRELVWLGRLFKELTTPFPKPITVFYDGQSTMHIARNPLFHERTKRIEVDCHFVRSKLQEGISLQHVGTCRYFN